MVAGDLPASLVSKYYDCVLGLVKVQNVKFECHFILIQRYIQIVHRAVIDTMPLLNMMTNIMINSMRNICFIAAFRHNNEKHYFNVASPSNLVKFVLKCGQYFVHLLYSGLLNDPNF